MVTSNNFFRKIKHDSVNYYLEDLWSEIVVTFVLRERQTIEYKTQLTAKASILKQGFQKTHFLVVLEVEIFLLSIWLTSTRCAKFQIPNSILTWLFRHLNMAFLGYFTQFRITVLARFCAIFIIF